VIQFDRAQLVAFVRAMDRNLDAPATLMLVGGAAASLGYGAGVRTADIDVFNVLHGSSEQIIQAASAAREQTGLPVGVGAATVADLPYNYEDRIRQVRGLRMKNLTLLVPDKYDLALSKALRGYPHDIDAIQGIDEKHPLSQETLVARFEDELMNEAVAERRKIQLNVAMVVARLYGIEEGRKLAERWGVPSPQIGRR